MSTLLSAAHKEKLLAICGEKGGELVSERRDGRKITLRCERGHIWNPDLYNVIKGSWCGHPDCVSRRISRRKVDPIRAEQSRKLKEAIEARGGKWVSGEYRNNSSHVEVQCAKGHKWKAAPFAIWADKWCPRCAGRLPKDEMLTVLKNIAESRGGKLLSVNYENAHSKIKFQCGEGHSFLASADSVKRGSWCPKCAPNGGPMDLNNLKKELTEISRANMGVLVDLQRCGGSDGFLATMRCVAGHEWTARSYNLRNGHWCPTCNMPGVREKYCRAVFEWVCGSSFQKQFPEWLVNSRGNVMELDGCNFDLKLAFEYQGEQHSKRIDFFHADEEAFQQRLEDDRIKAQLCEERGIDLLQVDISVPLETLQTHVLKRILKVRPDLEGVVNSRPLDLSTVRTGKDLELEEIERIARNMGGECTSVVYIASNSKLNFRCAKGHEWSAVPSSIKAGSWCPECKGERITEAKLAARDMTKLIRLVADRGGEYLGPGKKNRLKFLVRCASGHEWETDIARLRKGHWCQRCAAVVNGNRMKLSIEDLRKVAKERGGTILSKRYINSQTKYLWKCDKDDSHLWLATAASVRRGSWCPACAGKENFLFTGDVEKFLRDEESNAAI